MKIKINAKKMVAIVLTVLMAASITACSSSSGTAQESSVNESSLISASTDASNEMTSDLNNQINDLLQQETKVYSEHKDLWDKAADALMDSTAEYTGNYADFLAASIEESKDSFTDDEYKTLNEDIEKIREYEDQITVLQAELDSLGVTSESSSTDDADALKDISGKDFDGNDFDSSIFSNNAVTVVNFWFTGCKPCVAELSKLNELNETLKDMGGEVVGINTDTSNYNETAIEEAKTVLESQGATYKNLSVYKNTSTTSGNYISSIMAFPTTVLVDRNGKIVGDPLLGGIDNEENYNTLMEQINAVIEADSAN